MGRTDEIVGRLDDFGAPVKANGEPASGAELEPRHGESRSGEEQRGGHDRHVFLDVAPKRSVQSEILGVCRRPDTALPCPAQPSPARASLCGAEAHSADVLHGTPVSLISATGHPSLPNARLRRLSMILQPLLSDLFYLVSCCSRPRPRFSVSSFSAQDSGLFHLTSLGRDPRCRFGLPMRRKAASQRAREPAEPGARS